MLGPSRLARVSWLCLLTLSALLPLFVATRTDDTVRTVQWAGLWALAAVAVGASWASGARLVSGPLRWPLAGMAVTAAVMPVLAFRPTSALVDSLGLWSGVGVAGLAGIWLKDSRRRRKVAASLVGSNLLVAAYGYLQYMGVDPLHWAFQFGGARPFSTLGNPNFLAGHFAATLPWMAAAFLLAVDPVAKAGWLLLTLAWGLLILVSQTRGAWIASVFGLLLVFRLIRRREPLRFPSQGRWLAVLGTVTAAAVILSVAANRELRDRIADLVPREFGQVAKRWTSHKAGLLAFRASPISGIGPGCFKHAFGRHMAAAMPRTEIRLFAHTYSEEYAHDDFLQILAEGGVLGFGAFTWLLVAAVRAARLGLAGRGVLPVALLAGGLALGIHGGANLPLHIAPTAFLFWLGVGLAGTLVPSSPPDPDPDPDEEAGPTPVPPLRLVPALSVSVLISVLAMMQLATSYYARRGKDAINFSAWAASARAWDLARMADWDDRREDFFAASMRFQMGRRVECVPLFEAELARNPYYMDGWANTGSALGAISAEFQGAGNREMAAKYLDRAEEMLRRAIELNPAYAEAYANLGVAKLQRKDRRGAVEQFRAALEIEPGLALAAQGLAQAQAGVR